MKHVEVGMVGKEPFVDLQTRALDADKNRRVLGILGAGAHLVGGHINDEIGIYRDTTTWKVLEPVGASFGA